jgi:hypothetical protein
MQIEMPILNFIIYSILFVDHKCPLKLCCMKTRKQCTERDQGSKCKLEAPFHHLGCTVAIV